MSMTRLKDFLDEQRVPYEAISHQTAFTAQCIAGLTHTPGRELAKTIIVNLDGELVMAVLPANFRVDLNLLRHAVRARHAALASEEEFYASFPDCETGAMPPFGNLYGLRVFADETLTRDTHITFNAGSHHEVLRVRWEDFVRVAQPIIVSLAARLGSEAA